MMLTFWLKPLVTIGVTVLALTDCGPVLYNYFPQTRTYEYERMVPIVVRTDPADAVVVTSDGTTLGQAPLILEEKVRVRRTYYFHSARLAIIGCIIDIGIGLPAFKYGESHAGAGLLPAVAILLGLSHLIGCFDLGLIKLANTVAKPLALADQQIPLFSAASHTDEEVLPRSIDLMARWDGLAESRATVEVSTTRMITLRLPRWYTFDEALILWARATTLPLSAESLYRAGNAYRNLAAQGVHGAKERAIEIFTRYLQDHVEAEHVDDVRRALADLGRLEGHQ